MAIRQPANYEEALARIGELEDELESLEALLLLRERAASDNEACRPLDDVARELDAKHSLDR